MAILVFSKQDVILNRYDKTTRKQLKRALRRCGEVICCDYNRDGAHPFLLQDVIRCCESDESIRFETYSFDQLKSMADEHYHLVPTGGIESADRSEKENCMNEILDLAVDLYDVFIVNSDGKNRFVHEPGLMTRYGGYDVDDAIAAGKA